MRIDRRLRFRLALQGWVFVVLAVVLAALAAIVARDHKVQYDLTSSARNTLSPASADILRKLEGPVTVTAFATPQDARVGDLRKLIRDFVGRYQRLKPDLRLEFVDPREQPKAAAAAGVQVNGEMVIEHGGRTERLAGLSELEFSNALIRLARSAERLVLYLDGHGERSLNGGADHDLGEFGRQLGAKGIAINALNLAIAPEVPENSTLLVVASPQVDLTTAEVEKLLRHLDRGGNLLWLIDQEPMRGLEPVAEALGLALSPGTVVDPEAVQRGGRPVMSVASPGGYAGHPVTQSLRLNTVFPFARAIGASPGGEWTITPLIEVAQRGWLETDPLEGRITFDQARDVPGPVTIAAALERARQDRSQRVLVVGTGHFLANAYLGNGGNLDLGMSMVNWLIGDDALIGIEPRSAPDTALTLSRPALLAIVVVFLILAPLGFFAAGAFIWWRRRKASAH